MDPLEHSTIKDLHIENSSNGLPPEYPQYPESEEQAEFSGAAEWSAVRESGEPETRGESAEAKTVSGKAVTMAQRLKQLLTFVALIAAAAIIVPDIVPVLDLGSPELHSLYFDAGEESVSFSIEVETMSGDELTVILQNDFQKEQADLILGNFSEEQLSGDPEYYDGSGGSGEEKSDRGIFIQEEYFVSAGPDPTFHMVYGEAYGLKPEMTYRVTVICGEKTLFTGNITVYPGQNLVYTPPSKSSHY